MGIGFRKSARVGSKHLHVKWTGSKTGVSRTVKVGPVSRNSRSQQWHVDLPGPFFWNSKRKKRHLGDKSGSTLGGLLGLVLVIGVLAAVALLATGNGDWIWSP